MQSFRRLDQNKEISKVKEVKDQLLTKALRKEPKEQDFILLVLKDAI